MFRYSLQVTFPIPTHRKPIVISEVTQTFQNHISPDVLSEKPESVMCCKFGFLKIDGYYRESEVKYQK